MSKEQQELLDKAYENYLNKAKNYTTEELFYNKLSGVGDIIEGMLSAYTRDFIPYSKEEFINKIKTDSEFSEKWGLKIEERELSLEERYHIWFTNNYETGMERYFDPNNIPKFDDIYYEPTPTKLITITYNNKTIESYE
jgi:hypothetical protein